MKSGGTWKREKRKMERVEEEETAPMCVKADPEILAMRPASLFVSNKDVISSNASHLNQLPAEWFLEKCKISKSMKDNFEWMRTDLPNKSVLIVRNSTEFAVCGHVKLTPCFGQLEIWGAQLSTESSMVLYSSQLFRSVSVRAKPLHEHAINWKEKFRQDMAEKKLLSDRDFERLISNLNADDVVVVVTALESPSIFNARHYLTGTDLKPPASDAFSLLPDLSKFGKLAVDTVANCHYPLLEMPESWDQLNGILKRVARVLVVGGKSCGKSTLGKYLVNRLLRYSEGGHVLWLECDPGQGEFGPPGSVALYLITEPVFGPNFSHLMKPILSFYLGHVDVVQCSAEYLESIGRLIEQVAEPDYFDIPWVVNTMGFTQGLGVHLNKNVIKMVKPTAVIELKCREIKRNFKEPLNSSNVDDSLVYDYITLDSVANSSLKSDAINSKKSRERMLLSYFSALLSPPHYTFNATLPYVIALSELTIGIGHDLAVRDVLTVLNGSLVSLCETPAVGSLILRHPDSGLFQIAIRPGIQPCLGLGLVRGIDLEKKELYLLTPEPLETMHNVCMLVLGNIQVPDVVFTRQRDIHATAVPYVMHTTDHQAMVHVTRINRPVPATVHTQ